MPGIGRAPVGAGPQSNTQPHDPWVVIGGATGMLLPSAVVPVKPSYLVGCQGCGSSRALEGRSPPFWSVA